MVAEYPEDGDGIHWKRYDLLIDKFFQSIEPWWGMVRSDDSKRPSWFAIGGLWRRRRRNALDDTRGERSPRQLYN